MKEIRKENKRNEDKKIQQHKRNKFIFHAHTYI